MGSKTFSEETILSKYKVNIISWYNFVNTNSILLIGDIDNNIIDFLCSKFEKVFAINKGNKLLETMNKYKNFEIIDEDFLSQNKKNNKFDYALLMNYFEDEIDENVIDFINNISNFVQDDGRFLAIFKNKLGAKEFVENNFEGFSRTRIEKIINNLNFKFNKFYYALPNEEYANIIFSDEYLPTETDIRRNLNFAKIASNSGILENKILTKTLSDYRDDFKMLANLFFIELSKKEFANEIKAVFYSNIRNEKYQIKTKILEDIAVKEAIYESGKEHISEIKDNIDILKKCNINSLDSYKENKIISKLAIDYERLDNKFFDFYMNNNIEYKNIMNRFKNDILLKLQVIDSKNNVFEKLNIDVSDEILNDLTFVKYGLWDLTLQNIFLINDELYVYDQEWFEENIPLEFMIYRTIFHNFETLSEDEKDELYKEFGIYKFKDIFYELEEKIQVDVTNRDVAILYANTISSSPEDVLKNEKSKLLDELDLRDEISNINKKESSNIHDDYDLVVSQRDNLQREIELKENRINALQVAISNSKTLNCTRKIKKIVKVPIRKIIGICEKSVRFFYNKTLTKNMKKKIKSKAEYSKKLSKLIGIPMIHEYNHTMKLYNRKDNTYKDVFSQFKLDNKTIGIHLHLYYEDLADEFCKYLSNIPYDFDLYISIRQGVDPNCIKKIFKKITNLNYLEVVTSENNGRDFGPMFVLFAEKLKKYNYIMHIHSKKSLRSGQEQSDWRRYLLDNLLGSTEFIMKEFYLMEHLNCGLVYPDTHYSLSIGSHTWLAEKELAKKIMKEIGVEFKDEFLEFSAGSMFWAKKDALKQLLDLNLTWEDFGKDKQQVEGTLEYVFERIPGTVAKHNNYDIAIYNTKQNVFLLNKGNKVADNYFSLNSEIFLEHVKISGIVSFDIFETLVTMKIYNQDDMFLLIEKELKNKNIELVNYTKFRKKAEEKLSKNNYTYTIDEIYDEFARLTNITKEQSLEIKNVEVEITIKLYTSRKEVQRIYNEVIKMGREIIFVCDTYLTKDIVTKILNNCGYYKYSDIWLSSEMKLKKSDGTMWEYFLSKFKDKRMIHFGDDEQDDVHFLANKGEEAVYLMRGNRLLELTYDYSLEDQKVDLLNSVLFGLIYKKSLFNSPFALYNNENSALIKTPFDLGYSTLGPLILNYILWIMKSVRDNANNKILLFASRNGYYLQKIYEHLKEKLEIKDLENLEEYYLLISERVISIANITNKEDIYNLFEIPYTGTLKEILFYKLGYISDKFENKTIELPKDIGIIREIIDLNYNEIMSRVGYIRENYIKYISSLSQNIDKKDIIFVDLECKENTQYDLSKFINKKISGKYFTISNNNIPLWEESKIQSCYNNINSLENLNYEYCYILEKFLSSHNGNLKYIDENLEPHYTFENNKNKVKYLNEIYNGIIELIDDMVDICGDDLLDMKFNTDILQRNYINFYKELEKTRGDLKKIFLD